MRVRLVVSIVCILEGLGKCNVIKCVQYLTAYKKHNLVVTRFVRHH
jgi:hypothetical protein